MYVVATVDAGTIQNAIAVPDSAVLRDSENQPFVYVEVCCAISLEGAPSLSGRA